VSAAANIVAGELAEVRKALKRLWNTIPVTGLPIDRADRLSGCIDRAVDQTAEAVRVLEGAEAGITAPALIRKRTVAWDPVEVYLTRVLHLAPLSVPTIIGQLGDAARLIRRCREALRSTAPYLDGYLDRAQDQTSAVIRALTTDAEAGIAWWNACTERERAHWCKVASSAVPAEAWAAFKADRKPKD